MPGRLFRRRTLGDLKPILLGEWIEIVNSELSWQDTGVLANHSLPILMTKKGPSLNDWRDSGHRANTFRKLGIRA